MSEAHDVVLCLNCGSSSLKLAVFVREGSDVRSVATASVVGVGTEEARAQAKAGGQTHEKACPGSDQAEALKAGIALLEAARAPRASVVGHRVVHGGRRYVAPTRVDGALVAELKKIAPLAPLHMAPAIAGIEAISLHHPNLPQVACFDTAFHSTLPDVARRLPLPEALDDDGIRRYGFHGLSYEYVVSVLRPSIPPRLVIAHLGSGASLVAVKGGRSVDTTMGLTPTGGVMMGTRSGDLDPGVLLYLLREKGFSVDALERLVEHHSGVEGVAGTADMKALVARRRTDPRADLAVRMFAYSVKKAIGGFAAALGGLDMLVFAGGIGERSPDVRAEACEGLAALGIAIDSAKNAKNAGVISADGGACIVRVVETEENVVIARHALDVVGRPRANSDPER